MKELLEMVLKYVWQAWRLRWLALLVAWIVALSAWLVVDNRVQDQFVAKARIVVETNQVLKPLLRDITVQNNVERRVALMSRTLLSRPNLENLIAIAGLDSGFKDDLERENFLTYLSQNLDLWGDSRNRSLYTIYFPHSDPQIAKQVVDSLITVFIDSSEGGNKEDSSAAQAFLDAQIENLETRLIDAETRLSAFKRKNAGSMPGESGGYYQRLEFSMRQLRQAQLDLREAENREVELNRQIRSETPDILIDGSAYIDPLDAQILDFKEQLSSLLVGIQSVTPEYSSSGRPYPRWNYNDPKISQHRLTAICCPVLCIKK